MENYKDEKLKKSFNTVDRCNVGTVKTYTNSSGTLKLYLDKKLIKFDNLILTNNSGTFELKVNLPKLTSEQALDYSKNKIGVIKLVENTENFRDTNSLLTEIEHVSFMGNDNFVRQLVVTARKFTGWK